MARADRVFFVRNEWNYIRIPIQAGGRQVISRRLTTIQFLLPFGLVLARQAWIETGPQLVL